MKIKKLLNFFIICMIMFGSTMSAAAYSPYKNYVPSYFYKTVLGPDAYIPEQTIYLKIKGSNTSIYTDIDCDSNGNLYIVDQANSCILIYNQKYELIKTLQTFSDGTKEYTMVNPEGIYISDEDNIYISDTGNQRILILNSGLSIINVIEKPQTSILGDDYVYQPTRLVVDNANHVYVIARNINRGLIEFDSKGNFSTFIGAPKVTVTFWDTFKKKFSTKAQKERMQSFVATEYSAVDIDDKGFIFVTTDTLTEEALYNASLSRTAMTSGNPIRRLNTTGLDILKSNGYRPPIGEVSFRISADNNADIYGASRICDVISLKNGIYSVLDNKRGHIFTYDNEGNMLYVYGTLSNVKGTTSNPVAMTHYGNKTFVLDQNTSTIQAYEITDYGMQVNNLVISSANGKYDQMVALSKELLRSNSNSDLAYNCLAKVAYYNEDYKAAYDYAKSAQNREMASKCYKYIRKDAISKYIAPMIITIIALIILRILINLVRSLRRIKKIYSNGVGLNDD